MLRYLVILCLLWVSTVNSQIYPLVTSINGQKVVIWTLDQDKQNSLALEKGFQLSKDIVLLRQDTANLQSAIKVQAKRIKNKDAQLEECSFRYGNQLIATEKARVSSEKWKEAFAKEEGKSKTWKILAGVGTGVGILVGMYVGFSIPKN